MHNNRVPQTNELRADLASYLHTGSLAIITVGLLGGWAGQRWPFVLALAVAQMVTNVWMGRLAQRRGTLPGYVYVSAFVNLTATASIVLITGGYHSPFWLLFLVSALTSALFLGQSGIHLNVLNVAVAAFALWGPELAARRLDWPAFTEVGMRLLLLLFATLIAQNARVFLHRELVTRKLAEANRRAAEARLADVIAIAADAIITVDEDQRILVFNKGAERMFGYRAEEVLGQPLDLLLPSRFAEAHCQHIADFAASPETVRRMDERRAVFGRRKDGAEFPAEVSIAKLTHNGQTTFIAIMRDVTERKRVEEALRHSEELFRSLIENASDFIAILGSDGTLRYNSPSVERILGYKPEDLLGEKTFEFVHPDDAASIISGFTGLVQDPGLARSGEFRFRHKDGSWRVLETIGSNLLDDPRVGGVVINARDITERKRAEERIQRQLQRLAALRQVDMAITASLDLRVTLNVLLEQVTAQLGVHAADVLLLNPYTQTLEYAVGRGFRSSAIARSRLRLGEGHVGRTALKRQTVSIPNMREAGEILERAQLLADEAFIAYYASPLIAKGQVQGLLEVFHRAPLAPDSDWLEFLEILAGQAAIAIDNSSLFDDLQRSNVELVRAYDATLEGWSRALELRDYETEGHSQRVTEMTLDMARAMDMSEAELAHVYRGALLHDIGKMGIPDSILLKPGPLTSEEWRIMRCHPVYAYEMLSPIAYLRPALDIPYCHHEKWDGTGYPRGLQGEQIPLAARIFAVADVWDALRSDRPYRPAWPEGRAWEYIREQAGKQFDPKVVKIFLEMEVT